MNNNYQTKIQQRLKHKETEITGYRPRLSHSIKCTNCHQIIDSGYELCPNCGNRLHSNHCTFCGAPMEIDDLFCGECGGSAKGLPCPSCGTLSFRSFCPKCNQAVDDLGRKELAKAASDPVYQRICALADRILEIQESKELSENEKDALTPDVMAILERYRSLTVANYEDSDDECKVESEIANGKSSGIHFEDTDDGIDDIVASIEELNRMLVSMVPDPGLTPQMQRNYFSARKVAVYHKSKISSKIGWVCNLCGCCHASPSECARPELGGSWIYEEKEITTKTYE